MSGECCCSQEREVVVRDSVVVVGCVGWSGGVGVCQSSGASLNPGVWLCARVCVCVCVWLCVCVCVRVI